MWRGPGTSGGHLPAPPASPARTASRPAVDGRKCAKFFRDPPHESLAALGGIPGPARRARRSAAARSPPGAARRSCAPERPGTLEHAGRPRVPTPEPAGPERREGRRTEVRRPSTGSARGRVAARRSAGDDLDRQLRADLGVHPHRDGVLARRLDAAGQLDAATVELRATGRGDRGGDVGGGDAAEQPATVTGAGRHAARSGRTAAPATASASSCERTSRAARARRSDSICFSAPRVAWMASPRGRR